MNNDLDLDELDQAVSAMMSSRRRKKAAPVEPVKTPDAPSDSDRVATARTGEMPVRPPAPRAAVPPRFAAPMRPDSRLTTSAEPRPVSAPITTVAPVATPVVATQPSATPRIAPRKRTHPGAMDIIQPKTTPSVAPPSARPTRTASALQPTRPVAPEAPRSVAPSAAAETAPVPVQPSQPLPAPTPTPDSGDVSDDLLQSLALNDQPKHTTAGTTLLDDSQQSSHGWPDPLDFHDFKHTEDSENSDEEAPSLGTWQQGGPQLLEANNDDMKKDTPPTFDQEAPAQAPATPLNPSPFLPTKVEKRPLGAYANASAQSQQTDNSQWAQDVDPTNETENPGPVSSEPVPQPAPSYTEQPSAQRQTMQTPPAPQPNHDQSSMSQNTTLGDLRHMSIPPQYHTTQPEPTDEVRNIFDVKEYHAAPHPVHHAKQSSPWLTVVIVVLCVLVVAVALAAYFMMAGIDLSKLW